MTIRTTHTIEDGEQRTERVIDLTERGGNVYRLLVTEDGHEPLDELTPAAEDRLREWCKETGATFGLDGDEEEDEEAGA